MRNLYLVRYDDGSVVVCAKDENEAAQLSGKRGALGVRFLGVADARVEDGKVGGKNICRHSDFGGHGKKR